MLDRMNETPLRWTFKRAPPRQAGEPDRATASVTLNGITYNAPGVNYEAAQYRCAKMAYECTIAKAFAYTAPRNLERYLDKYAGKVDEENCEPLGPAPSYVQVIEKYHRFKKKELKWKIVRKGNVVKVYGFGFCKDVGRGKCADCAKMDCARKMFDFMRTFPWYDDMCDASPSVKSHLGACPVSAPNTGLVEIIN